MITSKQIINLSETWERKVSFGLSSADVYVNPDSSDYIKMNKASRLSDDPEIRFVADAKTHKFYIWNANSILHSTILEVVSGLNLKARFVNQDVTLLIGEGVLDSGKSRITSTWVLGDKISNFYDSKQARDWLAKFKNVNWSWMSYYINYEDNFRRYVYPYLEKLKDYKNKK